MTVGVPAPNKQYWGHTVASLQTGVTIGDDNTITGTLKYVSEGSLPTTWGAGNFLALKFTANDDAESIKVGLRPSAGSGLVELDDDMDGVFKITDKDEQVFVIVQSDANGARVSEQVFDLSGLTLDPEPLPDAKLDSLSVGGLTLSPAFDADTYAYTCSDPYSSFGITAEADADLSVSATFGGSSIALTSLDIQGGKRYSGTSSINASGTLAITVSNGEDTNTYNVVITYAPVPEPTLDSLSFSEFSLDPEFDEDTYIYTGETTQDELTLRMHPSDDSLTVTAEISTGGTSTEISLTDFGGHYYGANAIPFTDDSTVTINVSNGSEILSYEVTITKSEAADTTLASLVVTGILGDLLPPFDPSVDSYTADADPQDGGVVTVTATPKDPNATVYVAYDGVDYQSGDSITLTQQGDNTIDIGVSNGDAKSVYTVIVTKH